VDADLLRAARQRHFALRDSDSDEAVSATRLVTASPEGGAPPDKAAPPRAASREPLRTPAPVPPPELALGSARAADGPPERAEPGLAATPNRVGDRKARIAYAVAAHPAPRAARAEAHEATAPDGAAAPRPGNAAPGGWELPVPAPAREVREPGSSGEPMPLAAAAEAPPSHAEDSPRAPTTPAAPRALTAPEPSRPAPAPTAPAPGVRGAVSLRIDGLEVRGSLATSEVRRALERVRPQLTACYARTPAAGTLRIEVDIDERGRARSPRSVGAAPAELARCVTQIAAKLVSGSPPDTGTVKASFTLGLSP
jgi:hypothetical protein